MSNYEMKQQIYKLINVIENEKTLTKIYKFVTKMFVRY